MKKVENMRIRIGGAYRKWCGLIFGAAAFIIVMCVLFAGDDIGLSDQGDFSRVMWVSSLHFGAKNPSHTYVDKFAIDLFQDSAVKNIVSILFGSGNTERYSSIHVAFVRISVVVNLFVNKLTGQEMSTYHIGVLGAIYAALYAAGIGFLLSQFQLRRIWQDFLVKAAALLILCDIGYVAYFNSLYGEAPEHIALVWCAAMLVRVLSRKPTLWDGLWCALAALCYGWAKFFNIPIALLLLAVMEGIVLVRSGRWQTFIFGGAVLAILLAAWTAVPKWMDRDTNYNAVFYGVLRDVDRETAVDYLRDLGLSEELADYRDTHHYIAQVIDDLRDKGLLQEAESVTKVELVKFYLTHPGRLAEQAKLAALHSGMVRPYYLANHGEGYPLMTYSGRMSLWSRLRDRMAFDTLWGCFAVTAVAIAMFVAVWHGKVRKIYLVLLLLTLLGGLCYAFLLPVMLNGEGDFAKHMFAYAELIDLLIIACLALAVDRAGRKRQGGVFCPAAGLALAAVLVLPMLCGAVSNARREGRSHETLARGAYVRLGSFAGEPLTWLVTDVSEDTYTLFCVDESILLPFDTGGKNDWASVSLREWLNGAFLEGFTPEELRCIKTGENTVILPNSLRDTAERGDLEFACSHIAVLADRFHERTYQKTVEDTVRLPGIELAAELARDGVDISGKEWWLETPYVLSTMLTRYVGTDGHIYFGDASAERIVRPVVEITATETCGGSGSRRDPFVLQGNAG